MSLNNHITKGSSLGRLRPSLGNKRGGHTEMGQSTVERGWAVNTAATPCILEDQAPAHTGFIIPDGLFVHNVKGHLEIAIVRDWKLPEEWAQKGCVRRWPATQEGGAAGPSCWPLSCKKCRKGGGASRLLSFLSLGPFVSSHPAVSSSLLPSSECHP